METEYRAGIVCCSNGLREGERKNLKRLEDIFQELNIIPVWSPCLYGGTEDVRSGSAGQRAEALMDFYRREDIQAVFDVSGGDIANEILPCLDYRVIADARDFRGRPKIFWGYSDLTVILNAVYAKTGNAGVLYQVRHLAAAGNGDRRREFANYILTGDNGLFAIDYEFIQGNAMEGVLVGGNIRCLLKLAGTNYFPDMEGKLLLLEAMSGGQAQMITYLSSLSQLGVFGRVRGILLGTFTQMEREGVHMAALVREFVPADMPIAQTREIGHGIDARAAWIGKRITLN